MPVDFTLLLPVHERVPWEQLREAFLSSVTEQTRRPSEVLVVVDGPIPASLDRVIAELVAASPVPAQVLRLAINGGLAHALNAGLAAVTTEFVARMDADDVSRPDRFALQLALIETRDLDIAGAALTEFRTGETADGPIRMPPLGAAAIRAALPWRQPFHHPTVVYRRSTVLAAGGYPEDAGRMEDYLLFARMLVAGARAANLAEPLLRYRVDDGAYGRRGGSEQLRSELRLQRTLLELGVTTRLQFLRNLVLRGAYRAVPTWVRRAAYRRAMTDRSGS